MRCLCMDWRKLHCQFPEICSTYYDTKSRECHVTDFKAKMDWMVVHAFTSVLTRLRWQSFILHSRLKWLVQEMFQHFHLGLSYARFLSRVTAPDICNTHNSVLSSLFPEGTRPFRGHGALCHYWTSLHVPVSPLLLYISSMLITLPEVLSLLAIRLR